MRRKIWTRPLTLMLTSMLGASLGVSLAVAAPYSDGVLRESSAAPQAELPAEPAKSPIEPALERNAAALPPYDPADLSAASNHRGAFRIEAEESLTEVEMAAVAVIFLGVACGVWAVYRRCSPPRRKSRSQLQR